ncbi:hypothetical protein Hypma_007354 [Hypsizygus marmoreus]|uniref:Bromo domain-containing protein n=1 Tax=Hypsizygus marmoreus TaxID=39966 RepID=A0A369JVM5_HYPMA|nr:hypothetical protein Hypma_007354 [Hypsizygus marmoreus]
MYEFPVDFDIETIAKILAMKVLLGPCGRGLSGISSQKSRAEKKFTGSRQASEVAWASWRASPAAKAAGCGRAEFDPVTSGFHAGHLDAEVERMNNLLRTLTETQIRSVHPEHDLKLLLTTVKEGRRQRDESKLSDAFYDSLEGLLMDLKSVTIDNHDAEPFLKPVSRADAPDYYDVIANPMDFGTMLKKVKSKQYKSKREFKDDLDLIWSNCYTYNAAENHPLRPCVKRLKLKADRLLKYITDRKERTDPPIPSNLPTTNIAIAIPRPKINGTTTTTAGLPLLNGLTYNHTRSPSFPTTNASKPGTPTISIKPSTPISNVNGKKTLNLTPAQRRDVPFPDTPAILRTREGMALFARLERESDAAGAGDDKDAVFVLEKMQELAAPVERFSSSSPEPGPEVKPVLNDAMLVDGVNGDNKRKINGHATPDTRPRKRARFSTQYATPLMFEKDDVSELWWGAVQSDALMANGLPHIPFASSSASSSSSSSSFSSSSSSSSLHAHTPSHTLQAQPRPKPKRRKKAPTNTTTTTAGGGAEPKSLLTMINNNIKTMKRLRHTHARFAGLNLGASGGGAAGEDGDGDGLGAGGGGGRGGTPMMGVGAGVGVGMGMGMGVDEDVVDDKVDERPWSIPGTGIGGGVGGKGKGKARMKGGGEREEGVGEIEIGEDNAADCVKWMSGKVLEHAGFQGTSQVALDVLASVTSEYLLNVGRTIRFLCDKYSTNMTPEEIILHTLFESGTSKVQDLERYISDDVERYGARLVDLEKKLVSAYRESTATEVLEDEGLFDEEDEEDAGALAIGDFADALGEDYLGLRELGIAAEFGMSSLSIPKKLLKGKKGRGVGAAAAAKPIEPPPPYPPPPPFIPLSADKVDDQIGLLKPYYQGRFAALHQPSVAVVAPLPGPSIPGYGTTPHPQSHPQPQAPSTNLVLQDDAPNPAQVKMGPLGQIIKGGVAGGGSKKKKGANNASGGGGGGGGGGAGVDGIPPNKKKKTGMVGVGTGNGRKKKGGGEEGGGGGAGMLPPIAAAPVRILVQPPQ